MLSVRKTLIFFLIFVIVGAFVAYQITNTAYDKGYDYNKYDYAIGNTDDFNGDPAQKKGKFTGPQSTLPAGEAPQATDEFVDTQNLPQ